LPFKANAERRHHIPKQRHRVTNSAAYDAALRRRGSLTVWLTDAAIAAWQAEPWNTRGGQPRYSALAIATALTLRAVFRLALRQTEGLIGFVITLLGLTLVPCCMDRGCGRSYPSPGCSSGDADGDRASKLQHAVERMDGDVHLGRPATVRA